MLKVAFLLPIGDRRKVLSLQRKLKTPLESAFISDYSKIASGLCITGKDLISLYHLMTESKDNRGIRCTLD